MYTKSELRTQLLVCMRIAEENAHEISRKAFSQLHDAILAYRTIYHDVWDESDEQKLIDSRYMKHEVVPVIFAKLQANQHAGSAILAEVSIENMMDARRNLLKECGLKTDDVLKEWERSLSKKVQDEP